MAKIPEFSEDMEIIQKLSDYPEQDMMSTSQFKACFDKAGILIKAFINKHVVPAINNYVASQDGLLKTVGGTMTGDISMSGNKVTGLGAPAADTDAATKGYADNKLPKSGGTMTGPIAMGGNRVTGLGTPTDAWDGATKGYVDGKHLSATVSLPAASWAGDAAPYTQTVAVPGMLEADRPHYGVVYSGTAEEKAAQKEGFSLVDDLDTAAGSVTFTCFEEKPTVGLTIQLEVNR